MDFPKYNVRKNGSEETWTRMFAAGVYNTYNENPRMEICREDITTFEGSTKTITEPLESLFMTDDEETLTLEFQYIDIDGTLKTATVANFLAMFGGIYFLAEKLNTPPIT